MLGVSWYEVQLEEQKVKVKGSMPYEEVLGKIKKTGKEVSTSCDHDRGKLKLCLQVLSGTTVE
jgi:hypothetical protein